MDSKSLRRFNYTLEMTDFMIIEFPDRFYVYDGEPRQSLAKFIADQANQTTCDISLVDRYKFLFVLTGDTEMQ